MAQPTIWNICVQWTLTPQDFSPKALPSTFNLDKNTGPQNPYPSWTELPVSSRSLSCLLSILFPSCRQSASQESFFCSHINDAPVHIYLCPCICLILVTRDLKLASMSQISNILVPWSLKDTCFCGTEKNLIAKPVTSKAQDCLCIELGALTESTRIPACYIFKIYVSHSSHYTTISKDHSTFQISDPRTTVTYV